MNYIARPVEDYVLARLTMLENLAKLPIDQRQAVIMDACGFSMTEWARMKGTVKQATAQNRRKGLANLVKEDFIKPVIMCIDCNRSPAKTKGRCANCYGKWYYKINKTND